MNELDEYELSLHSSDHRINQIVNLENRNEDINVMDRDQRDLDLIN